MRSEVPAGWEVRRIGELARFVTSGSRGWAKYYADQGAMFLRITNLTRGSINPDFSNAKFVELPAGLTDGTRTRLQGKDILISITADLGIIGIVPDDIGESYISQHIALVRLDQERLVPHYVAYYLASDSGRDQFDLLNDSGAKSGLNLPSIRAVSIPLPPLPEQKKVAAILSSVDVAIQATQGVIEQTRRVKEGLLQELLTRGIGHTRFKQTPIGEIPETWEAVDLQHSCREKITYGIVQCGPNIDDGIPYIRVSDMQSPELAVENMLRTSPEIAAKFHRSRVETGDIVFALRGAIGEVRLVRTEMEGANLTQGTARLSPGPIVRSEFLLWALRCPTSIKQVNLDAKGSTFREITLARLRKILVPVPPLNEQDSIIEDLNAAEDYERSCRIVHDNLRNMKQGLLQDLLTGKVRVSV